MCHHLSNCEQFLLTETHKLNLIKVNVAKIWKTDIKCHISYWAFLMTLWSEHTFYTKLIRAQCISSDRSVLNMFYCLLMHEKWFFLCDFLWDWKIKSAVQFEILLEAISEARSVSPESHAVVILGLLNPLFIWCLACLSETFSASSS